MLFDEVAESQKSEQFALFEAQKLNELAPPIAKAWRTGGVRSRIASSTYYRWLAESLWPGEVTAEQLLEFAVTREGLALDSRHGAASFRPHDVCIPASPGCSRTCADRGSSHSARRQNAMRTRLKGNRWEVPGRFR